MPGGLDGVHQHLPPRELGQGPYDEDRPIAGCGLIDPPDGGTDSDGAGNPGHLADHLEQVCELIGGDIGADLNRIIDARGLPGPRAEPAPCGHPDPSQSNFSGAASR